MLKQIKKFTDDRSGQFALMFGLLSFPLLASVGMALDYSSVSQQRGHIQNANDAAALWAAAHYRDHRTLPSPLATKSFIISNFPEEFGMQVGLPILSYGNDEVTILAQVEIKSHMMHMFGTNYKVSKVRSSAAVDIDSILEFALALDTTGSMAFEGRLSALKRASNNFITKIWDLVDHGADVKGAIVPFSNYVNVGTQYRNEPWTNVPADVDTRRPVTSCTRPVIGQTNCTGGGVETCYPATHGVTPAVPAGCRTVGGGCTTTDGVTVCQPTSQQCWPATPARPWSRAAYCTTSGQSCDPVYGPEQCTTRIVGKLYTWKGIVSSLPYPQNLQDGGNRAFPGPLDVSAGSPLLRLTDKESSLKAAIRGLVAEGNTYIPDGIMWALRALSPEAPFTEGRPVYTGAPGQKRIRKAIILMTDGENTASPNFGGAPVSPLTGVAHRVLHNGTDKRKTNQYTTEACNYVKNKGYEVYTVTFGRSVNNTIKNLMENCASTSDDYYHALSARDLDEAFEEIANSLLRLRLTH